MSWDYHQPQQTTATGTTNYLCRSTGKPCQNATEYGYCKQTVCNNSGALCIYDCRGMCIKHSDDEVQMPCIEGPCEDYKAEGHNDEQADC